MYVVNLQFLHDLLKIWFIFHIYIHLQAISLINFHDRHIPCKPLLFFKNDNLPFSKPNHQLLNLNLQKHIQLSVLALLTIIFQINLRYYHVNILCQYSKLKDFQKLLLLILDGNDQHEQHYCKHLDIYCYLHNKNTIFLPFLVSKVLNKKVLNYQESYFYAWITKINNP